jgi:hypothetical protein
LRFANNRLVCSRVGGVAASSNVEQDKIACCGRGRDLLIIQRTPVTGTVNNRGFPESFRREGQHDTPSQTKLPGLLQSNEISSASSRTDKCHSMHLVKSFADASPNLLDVLEGESRHLRLWQINPASSKRDYRSVYDFHRPPHCHCTK